MATVNVAVVLPAAVLFVIALAGIWFIGYLFRGLRPNASDEPREQNLLTVSSGPSEPVWWPMGATGACHCPHRSTRPTRSPLSHSRRVHCCVIRSMRRRLNLDSGDQGSRLGTRRVGYVRNVAAITLSMTMGRNSPPPLAGRDFRFFTFLIRQRIAADGFLALFPLLTTD
jgi:hypothetical protein